jgi:hypothetical protein
MKPEHAESWAVRKVGLKCADKWEAVMTTLEFKSDVKSTVAEPEKASQPPGVLLMVVLVGVVFGLAAVSLLGM